MNTSRSCALLAILCLVLSFSFRTHAQGCQYNLNACAAATKAKAKVAQLKMFQKKQIKRRNPRANINKSILKKLCKAGKLPKKRCP